METWRVLMADAHALLIQRALERATDGHVVLRRPRDGKNLREFEVISRGARDFSEKGGAAEGPSSYILKKALPVIGFATLLAMLLLWAWASGVL